MTEDRRHELWDLLVSAHARATDELDAYARAVKGGVQNPGARPEALEGVTPSAVLEALGALHRLHGAVISELGP